MSTSLEELSTDPREQHARQAEVVRKYTVKHHQWPISPYSAPLKTTQRRQFERAVYDFARSLGMSSQDAKEQMTLTCRRCSSSRSNDNDSAWEGELDDTEPFQSANTGWSRPRVANDDLIGRCSEGIADRFKIVKHGIYKQAMRHREVANDVSKHIEIASTDANNSDAHELNAPGTSIKRPLDSTKETGLKEQAAKRIRQHSKLDKPRRKSTRQEKQSQTHRSVTPSVSGKARGSENQIERVNALEPKTQKEAHENFLRAKAKRRSRDTQFSPVQQPPDKAAMGQERIQQIVDFGRKKQIDQFDNGLMKGLDKDTRLGLQHQSDLRKEDKADGKNLHKPAGNLSKKRMQKDKRKDNTKTHSSRGNDVEEKRHQRAKKHVSTVAEGANSDGIPNTFDPQPTLSRRPQTRSQAVEANVEACVEHNVEPSSVECCPAALSSDVPDAELKTQTTKRKPKESKTSPFFPLVINDQDLTKLKHTKSSPKKNVSCIPFPPLTAARFGLAQERVAHDPFRLLVAVMFLNKTRGAVAMPVFFQLMERYPTPLALANAQHDDVLGMIHHLGLQNQRARSVVRLAQAWLDLPPQAGRRFRRLHYPRKGDGSDVKPNETLGDDSEDPRVGFEVAHLPGLGAYAIDSWRIFCRDDLRGTTRGEASVPEQGYRDAADASDAPEWTKVVPQDKELRAYLRWRWLQLGWVWDPLTGARQRATQEELVAAGEGGVIIEDDGVNADDMNSLHVP